MNVQLFLTFSKAISSSIYFLFLNFVAYLFNGYFTWFTYYIIIEISDSINILKVLEMTDLEVKDTYLNNMHVQYNRRILRFIKGIVRAQKNTINCYFTININVFTHSKWILHKKTQKDQNSFWPTLQTIFSTFILHRKCNINFKRNFIEVIL